MAEVIRVLYVDDEPGLLNIGKRFLEKSGNFEVTTALTAPDAVRLLEQVRFDAIISDYQMPEMDGIQFLVEVRTRFGPIPFILFTGRGREEVVIQALNSGVDFYLQKGGEPKSQFAELSNKILYAVTRRRAEMDLRESEERYRHVVEDQTELICRFLPDGTHIFVNDAYCRYFGEARENILSHRFRPVIHPDDFEAVVGFFASLTLKNPVGTIDHRVILPDGSIRWQRWVDRAIFKPDGSPGEYQSVGRDITEHKHAMEAQRESEEKYQSLFATMRLICDNVPDMIWAKDLEKRFIFVNTAICRDLLNAADTDEPIGKNDMFFAERERTRHADDPDWHTFGEICRDTDQITMDAGTPQQFDENGNVQGNYLFLDVHKAPLNDEQGQMIGTVGSARDVTVSKQLETALRESEEKFRMLLLHVPSIAVQGYSMDGTTNYWYDGAENLYGYSAEEAIGKNLVELIIPPEMREEVRKAITYMTETGQPIPSAELSLMKKDGSRVAVFSSHVIIKRSQGEMELYCIDIDLTHRKQTEEALRQANRKLNLLSSITRHDINNQITVLQGYLSILEEQQPDATHNEYFQEIANAAKRISAMIRFTKGYEEIGAHVPVWQDCRLLVDMAAKQAALGKVMVKNDLPAGTEVFADPLITRVFYNLMDNAARYGGKITTIRFSVEESGDDQVIVCEDDGDGVPAFEKEKVFERGFGKNTGLGLALAREILDITGITIKETGEPGKGARFEMTVPKGMWRVMEKK